MIEPIYKFILGDWVLAGHLELLESGQGTFTYALEYVKAKYQSLDPDQLRKLISRKLVIPARSRYGIPGIIQDAGPDSWGRAVLEYEIGRKPNALEALKLAMDDGVGDLVVGEPNQKKEMQIYTLSELSSRIQARIDGIDYGSSKESFGRVLSPETALGGAKPKASILLEEQYWIAKFPERGDPITLACHEDFAMKLGQKVGIDTATSQCKELPDGKWVYLVKRFDRFKNGDEITRTGFASAMTVLGQTEEAQHYSYIEFAKKLKTWIPKDTYIDAIKQLWRRIAFSALIGNLDDHARNHALIQQDGRWMLSPAYDILPTRHKLERYSLSMTICDVDGQLTSIVSARNLIVSAESFGMSQVEAHSELIKMGKDILDVWASLTNVYPKEVGTALNHSFQNVLRLTKDAELLDMSDIAKTKKLRKSWNWAP